MARRAKASTRTMNKKMKNVIKSLGVKKIKTGQDARARRQMPPVMVRGVSQSGSKPIGKRNNKRIKRRFDIALSNPSNPGVEIRLPSLPVFKIGWRALSIIMVSCLGFLLYYLWNSPMFLVSTIDVKGALRLAPDEIITSLNVVDKTIFNIDPLQLEEILLRTFPQVSEISVKIKYPAQVFVEVIERVPMISWQLQEDSFWIDGNGYVYKPQGDSEKLVIVNANIEPPMKLTDLAETATEGDSLQPQGNIPTELVSAIFKSKTHAPEGAELVYDTQHGLGWLDSRGWEVFLGSDVSDLDSKFLIYQAVLEKLQSDGLQPDLINVEYIHSPYYRMEQ